MTAGWIPDVRRISRPVRVVTVLATCTVIMLALTIAPTQSQRVAVSAGASSRPYAFASSKRAVAASATPACAWSVVPSPNPRVGSSLDAVAASSATDVWAVGVSGVVDSYGPAGFWPRYHSLIEHFDGKRWSVVAGESGPASHAFLTGVSALPNGEAWAVGWGVGARGHYGHLISHPDRTARQGPMAQSPRSARRTLLVCGPMERL